jgi:site-specific recombinase XerD
MKTYALSAYLQRFFTERLGAQMKASPNTVASYRDAFRLLLRYAADLRKKEPTALQVADIDADLVAHFLTDLEKTRGNGARSRNTRLAAIRSFFKYVAVNEPQLLHHCQRVLAMPAKRHEKRAIDYLDRDEIEAVIAAPDLSTWHGRRDRAILVLTLQTGLRVTELITLTCGDITRTRCARALHGQGPQGACDPDPQGQRQARPQLVGRAHRQDGRCTVHQQQGRPPEPRCDRGHRPAAR